MIDFKSTQKRFLAITLLDGRKLAVRMPTKKVFDSLLQLREIMPGIEETTTDILASVYDLAATILSNNMAGVKISGEELGDMFDIEDIQIFYFGYMDFVQGVTQDPN